MNECILSDVLVVGGLKVAGVEVLAEFAVDEEGSGVRDMPGVLDPGIEDGVDSACGAVDDAFDLFATFEVSDARVVARPLFFDVDAVEVESLSAIGEIIYVCRRTDDGKEVEANM